MEADERLSAPAEQTAFRVAVLASGSGSNLQAIIDRLHRPRFRLMDADDYGAAPKAAGETPEGPRIEVVLVISDMPDARALDRATRAGIRTALLPVSDYRDREQHDLAVVTKLLEVEPGNVEARLLRLTDKVSLIDALSIARTAGNALAENIVMLGALSTLDDLPVPEKALKDAVAATVPKKAVEVNLRAFDMGKEEARSHLCKLVKCRE